MTEPRVILRNMRDSRDVTREQLAAAAAARGHTISKSSVGAIERGDRKLNDRNIRAFLAGLDNVTEREHQLLNAARAGIDTPEPIDEIRAAIADLAAELAVLRGEIRGGFAQVLEAVYRSAR
jgi:hypothetical protein